MDMFREMKEHIFLLLSGHEYMFSEMHVMTLNLQA